MGKKTKIGKQRKDKYYHLAKEAGYRSRAAFKLIQLNKRFEFLQRSQALVDLCAAPGGWLQVASQNMPVSSLRIGVDLVPIKSIPNCITLQGDITEEKTRHMVKKELQTWEADCVLHDGAPNVGSNWGHDAFQQNCLTLYALRLTTQILRKNGYFVTKIFRSSDWQQLVGVFEKLFRKVHVWKPAASRLESAEIFVVCERYLKPAKVDPELLDVKKVFLQQSEEKSANPMLMLTTRKKDKKPKAEGYEDGDISLFHEVKASDFLRSHEALLLLTTASCITLDSDKYKESPHTNPEILECIKDIKVCGPSELRTILMWRKKINADLRKEQKSNNEEKENESTEPVETPEEKELREIDELIQSAQADEKTKLRKKKRKLLKEKARHEERKKFDMVREGDSIQVDDHELFSLRQIMKAAEYAQKNKEAKSEEEYPSGDEDDVESLDNDSNWETRGGSDEDDDADDIINKDGTDDMMEKDLLHDEETYMDEKEKASSRSEKWFSRISTLLDEGDEEEENLDTIAKHMKGKMSKKQLHKNTVSFDEESKTVKQDDVKPEKPNEQTSMEMSSDESSEDEYDDVTEGGLYVRKRKADLKAQIEKNAKKPKHLTPEQLAMGELMIYSSKTRRDVEDWGWNRYANNDTNLPDWFVEDERAHCRKELPVTKEQVEFYKERQKELNVRPIKKVLEAKARKQKRRLRKLSRAKKVAENIMENESMEHREKVKEMRKIYKKALKPEKKDVKYQVMTKGKRGRLTKPNGPYRVVDRRLKADTRKTKRNAKVGRGKAKGRKARK
ncbi:ftsJ-like methyltransferase domain-containing protein [Ditylenchus destructor]|uniref:Putative rRNA methyltransferase n=1 Tax=Ditylenchus destructor TaxID=166010 RepID=A0AAD4RE13_9BILA|nr:ftsJ-like methyltransferase domain-containing protein [Ditylenchus destructor]